MLSASLACIRVRSPNPGTSFWTVGDAGSGSSSGPAPSGGQAPGTSRQSRPTAVQLAGTWEDVAARSVRTLSRHYVE